MSLIREQAVRPVQSRIAHQPMIRLVLTLTLTSIVLAGCSSSEDENSNPYEAELRSARERATSDFERRALEDLRISRAEYQEAVDRFVQCMRDRGIEASAVEEDTGLYSYRWPKAQDSSHAETACRAGTIEIIQPIYGALVRNPENIDEFELLAKCLIRKSVVPMGYSGEQARRDVKSNFKDAPFGPEDEGVKACMTNPSG